MGIDNDGNIQLFGRVDTSFKFHDGSLIHPELIELELKTSPLVSGSIVVGEDKTYLVALIAIERDALRTLAQKKNMSVDDLAASPEALALVDVHVKEVNKKLQPHLRVQKYKVIPREFSVREAEVTPTMLLNRSVLLK